MADTQLPPKPELNSVATFWFLPKVGLKAKGRVTRFVVDTDERWKVEIEVHSLEGPDRYIQAYEYYIGQQLMFEHYNLVTEQNNTSYNTKQKT